MPDITYGKYTGSPTNLVGNLESKEASDLSPSTYREYVEYALHSTQYP
jgi:hypothetical protein